jgi:hypothetical protein
MFVVGMIAYLQLVTTIKICMQNNRIASLPLLVVGGVEIQYFKA